MSANPSPRHGVLDLCLVLIAAYSVWSHTAVGGALDYVTHRALGRDGGQVALEAFFTAPGSQARISRVIAGLEDSTWRPGDSPADGFPQPYRTAVGLTLEHVDVAALDALWTGDAESTLETFAIGTEQRTRAVQRARAAGVANPEHYASHRPFLPRAAVRAADETIAPAMAVGKLLVMAWPIRDPHRVSSPYGMRTHPVTGIHKLHNGVDLAVPIGTEVFAIQDGRVAATGEDRANGRFVVIDHGHGVRSTYCHLSEQLAIRGNEVGKDTLIARSGNTGRSTGPHLHFTLRVGKRTVDPLPLKPSAGERE